jgi:predicted CXXCH cytochrome family protein
LLKLKNEALTRQKSLNQSKASHPKLKNRRMVTMKIYLFAFIGMLLLAGASYDLTYADNGPHGGFSTPTTDSCSGCHRTHTGQEQKLLMNTTSSLCESCHGSAGTGADTNVWDGVYLTRDAVTENPAEGVANRGLRGGGFVNARMNTNLGTSASSLPVTSSHTFNGTPGIMWGNGANGSGAGTSIALGCGNCHNPHGNAGPSGAATFRILRQVPLGSGASTGVNIADVTAKTYTVASTTGVYWNESYSTQEVPLSQWCSTCHSRYLAASGSESTQSGDAIFKFRHRSDGSSGVTCMDCHVAHGTSAVMGTNSGAVPWPDSSTTPSGNARSSLLRVDSRGICVQCHVNP